MARIHWEEEDPDHQEDDDHADKDKETPIEADRQQGVMGLLQLQQGRAGNPTGIQP